MRSNQNYRPVHYYTPRTPARRSPARAANASQRARVSWRTLAAGFVAVCLVWAGWSWFGGAEEPPPKKAVAPAVIVKKPLKPVITEQEMAAKINGVIAAYPTVDISVSVISLNDNKLFHYGLSNDIVYEAASVSKVITAAAIFDGVQRGTYSLDQTTSGKSLREHIRLMIENSDNASWHVLNDLYTREALLTYATSKGVRNYSTSENTLGPDDIARVLQQLYQGKLLNKQHTDVLLGFMKNANRADFIKYVIPDTMQFYHKAGWLEDRAHDAAIIDDGNIPFVLVIFTNGHKTTPSPDRPIILREITKPVLAHLVDANYATE